MNYNSYLIKTFIQQRKHMHNISVDCRVASLLGSAIEIKGKGIVHNIHGKGAIDFLEISVDPYFRSFQTKRGKV